MTDNPFPPIDPVRLPDQERRLVATEARVTHLRRRRKALTAGAAIAVILAVALPMALAGGPGRAQGVQVVGGPTTTASPSSTDAPTTTNASPPTTTPSPPPTTVPRPSLGGRTPTTLGDASSTTSTLPSSTTSAVHRTATNDGQAVTPSTSASPPTTAHSKLPEVIFDCTSPPPVAQESKVDPSSIVLACADNGLGVEDLAWTTWTSTSASGTGKLWENDCTPNCAGGKFGYYPATITLSGVENTAADGPLFSQLTAVYQGAGPNGHAVDHFALPMPPE